MTTIEFTSKARRNIRKISPTVRQRILTKLKWYASQPDPLRFADSVTDAVGKAHRFRVGDYRIIFDWEDGKIVVTEVGPRDTVYRSS